VIEAVTDDVPRYYRVKRNKKAFWEPGKFGASFGMARSRALGEDGPEAKKRAIDWNAKLDAVRAKKNRGEDIERSPVVYKPGTLGSFYEKFKETEAWGQMEPGTRDDYHRAWPVIEKRFGDRLVTKITADDSEKFHVDIHPQHENRRDPEGKLKLGWNTANRVLKVWRALLTALVAYSVIPAPAPIGRVTNPAPPGRSAVWVYDEVQKLKASATELGFHGVRAGISLGWDAMLSPVDVRRLLAGGFLALAEGGEVSTKRKKTKKTVRTAVSPETDDEIADYLRRLAADGIELKPTDFLIRNAKGLPYAEDVAGKNGAKYFQRDFAKVRDHVFPGDERQFLDLRRSAATEADFGGVDKRDLGPAMANSIAKDEKLQSTYIVSASRKVQEARLRGRAKMANAFRNAPDGVPK
jgi:hypothetical protein